MFNLLKIQIQNKNNSRRLVSTKKFADVLEEVIECRDYPLKKIQQYFKDTTLSVIGYGPQGRAQALNLKDNGLKVIVGLRPGSSYDQALKDGFTPGINLLNIEDAVSSGNVIMNLLSDAGQSTTWNKLILPNLTKNQTLYFSHGFSIVYKEQTKVIPPKNVDVIMVAPKGTGRTLRTSFKEGKGVNSSIAIYQNPSGKANETVKHLGFAIGSGYLYRTTFENEVYSDLVGERGVLMGLLQGAFKAQYDILRENGHSPSEAFNETVEEATQSLIPLIGENGMDWMYSNCSTTAQRGAIDWYPKFEQALKPVFQELYESVRNGTETKIVLDQNNDKDYRKKLQAELDEIGNQEIWRAGKTVRKLRKVPLSK
jgi:ketol-acid reductoisomerase